MQHASSTHYLPVLPPRRSAILAALAVGLLLLIIHVTFGISFHQSVLHLLTFIASDVLIVAVFAIGVYLVTRRYATAISARDEALRSSEQRYHQLRDATNDCVLMFPLSPNATSTCTEANSTAAQYFGYSQDELFAHSLRSLVSDDTLNHFDDFLQELCDSGTAVRELRLIHKSGKPLAAEIFAQVIPSEADCPPQVLCHIRAIDELKQLESALREARATSQTLMSSNPLALVLLDGHGNVSSWNEAAYTALGWTEYDVFGHPLPCIPPDDDTLPQLVQRAYQKETSASVSCLLRHRNGAELLALVTASPMLGADGSVDGIAVIFDTITVRLQQEIDLAKHAAQVRFQVKKAIFSAPDKETLYRGVCETLSQHGKYPQVWIGILEDDQQRTIRPVAWAGEQSDYLQAVSIRTADQSSASDPVACAVTTGNVVRITNLNGSPNDTQWLSRTQHQGLQSLVAIPLYSAWHVIGVLIIHAEQANAIPESIDALLYEIADDLTVGIETLNLRIAYAQAQDGLSTAEQQWRNTFDVIPDPIFLVDRQANIARCNLAAMALQQSPYVEILHASLFHIADGTQETSTMRALCASLEDGETRTEEIQLGEYWYAVTIHPMRDHSGNVQGALYVMRDTTAHKQATKELQRNYQRLHSIINDTIAAIIKIAELRDPYTAGHERRVSDLACAIGREMGLTSERLEGLRIAGMLHDIGKLYVPAEMLSRTGKLSTVEFEVIRAHSTAGYEILQHIDFPWPIAQMVLQHHERMDGTGYPNGLTGEDILLEARILAVADVVESMASHRPYRPSKGLDNALNEISRNTGIAFDTEVVAACLRVFHEQHYVMET